jgi:hypothetical protein
MLNIPILQKFRLRSIPICGEDPMMKILGPWDAYKHLTSGTPRLWNKELNGVDGKSNRKRGSMSTSPNGLVLFFNRTVITSPPVEAISVSERKMTDQETVMCTNCGEPLEDTCEQAAIEQDL